MDSYKSGKWGDVPIHKFDQSFAHQTYSSAKTILIASQYNKEISETLKLAGISDFYTLDQSFLESWTRKCRKRFDRALSRLSKLQFHYERRTAPFLARRASLLYWPLYKLFNYYNIRFLCNIAYGTGHITRDLDHFLLSLEAEKSQNPVRWVWITPSNDAYRCYMRLFRKAFFFSCSNTFLYDLIAPILMRFKDIAIDAGSTQIKWQLDEQNQSSLPFQSQTALNVLSLEEVARKWRESYRLHQQNPNRFPMRRAAWRNRKWTDEFLDTNRKVALIHIKEHIANASAKPTDPATYLPSLHYLNQSGYQLVFVGREKIPGAFKGTFDIYDYASSKHANLANDLYLFSIADLAIVGGGIACLASAMGTPFLYLNSWHIAKFWWPTLNVVVPTLLKRNGDFIHAVEQQKLHDELKDSQTFCYFECEAINANEQEILEGIKELERLRDSVTPESELQTAAKRIFNEDLVTYSSGRFSEHFLRSHEPLFSIIKKAP